MELLQNFRWQRWISFLVLACAVLAYRKLDIPGYTRQFISKVNNDCRDFKGVLNRCHVWKDMGFCFKYRRQMQHVCNRTCQYCVPGQKQWQVIDVKGILGQARKPAIAHGLSSVAQLKLPAIQILGKERAPQVDDAASAIATQLEGGIDHGISASPKVLGQLSKFHISLQNTLSPTKTKTTSTSDEMKGKLSTAQPVSSKDQEHKPPSPTDAPSISGTTQLKMHAPSLDTQAMNALQSNGTHDEGIENPGTILPVSSDDAVNQQAIEQMTMHAQQEASMVNSTSMADTALKPHSLEGMPSDLAGMVAGNKHGNINNPIVEMNRPYRKPAVPDSSGKQVTLTINEKPGTGEAVFKVQNSPHSTGLKYTTEGNPGNLLPPSYALQTESEEARAKSDEEETKIREATNAIKNVIKLFDRDNRHGHTRLVQQATQDFPGDSKSLEASRELAGIQSEYDAQVAQAQNQDRAKASSQALSQQSGPEFNSNEMGPGATPPNYAVVSTTDSKDWKNLAHVLATQLKRVLNHMEDREMENRYEKEKIQEEMMLMAQQQMMGRDEDEGPDDRDDDDDDDGGEMNNRDRRRHSVLSPYVKKRSENVSRNTKFTDRKSMKTNSSRKLTEHDLVHRAVKKLSRLEMLHKSKKQKNPLVK
ncbi:uncharacterized protein LOC144664276 isoform X2 [Oculina patagonica]